MATPRLIARLRGPLDAVGAVLFPPACGACHLPLALQPHFGLCSACFEVLEENLGERCRRCDLPGAQPLCESCLAQPLAFEALRAPYIYGGPLADLVIEAKFQHREDVAQALGELLADDEQARALGRQAGACVPVPLGPKRRRERGYNQSAIVARTLARVWGIPVRHALRRRCDTRAQSDLDVRARTENVRAAFVPRQRISGRVLLVDDVVTSGETVRAAALALRAAGAFEVRVVAVARAVLEKP